MTQFQLICIHYQRHNMVCKITSNVAEAFQRHLQPLLVEVIDSNQNVFLPLILILDNILLMHESIQWAKECTKIQSFLD